MKWFKKCSSLLVSALLLFAFASCGSTIEKENTQPLPPTEGRPVVTMTLSNDMKINLELYPDVAPITVNNFLKLVEEKFYDGKIFHRVIADFMIQSGAFYIDENNKLNYADSPTIKGEFSKNGVENNLKHTAGVLSMARSSAYDSASAQFFICVATCSWLDGDYAAFGKVCDEESLQNVIAISQMPTWAEYFGADMLVDAISIVSAERIA